MGILKKLFASRESSEEEGLLTSLHRLSEALKPSDSHWATVLAKFRGQAAAEFESGSPIRRRYQLAREIESLFGGMGSLNDIDLPGECQQIHSELFVAVQGVLRVYWRALGRESHKSDIPPLRVGAFVRLVPGTVRYFERDESPVVVKDTPEVRNQIWRVVRYEGPDITNMPSYLVQYENTFMGARHAALQLADLPPPS